MHSLDNCSARREVELSASAGGPDMNAKLTYVWTDRRVVSTVTISVSAGKISGGQGTTMITSEGI
jgi:hypothetical protein